MIRETRIAYSLGCLLLGGATALALEFSAGVDLTQAPIGSDISIGIQALPQAAFSGKDAVLPVEVISHSGIAPANLNVVMGYSLRGTDGTPIGTVTHLPVYLQTDPSNPRRLVGSARVPQSDLVAVQRGGQLDYYFRAQQGTGDTVLGAGAPSASVPAGGFPSGFSPFATGLIDELQAPVVPEGSVVTVPDLNVFDGNASVSLPPGAIAVPAALTIRQLDPSSWPSGPSGARPLIVYEMDLDGASLLKPVDVTLTYGADSHGKVQGTSLGGTDLALFYWDGAGWRLADRPKIDPVLHTVTARTPRLAPFALFGVGPVSAAMTAPRERILTPNGDGINDTASFDDSSISEVNIFDIRGRRVRSVPGPSPVWDGRNDSGAVVESGVYIYQYQTQGEQVSGAIMVAK